jgi:GNAT superfamily N-acetyltransferase
MTWHYYRMVIYTLEPVDDLDPGATEAVRRIYEDGFPVHLRSEFNSLTAGRKDGEIALAMIDSGQPRGFVMLRPLGGTGWMYLRYFVVDGRLRGQGIGGILWDMLTDWLTAESYTVLVFDVEDPAEPGCDPAEVTIRNRRIAFYERHGARLLPVRGYVVPEAGGWTPLLLVAAPLTASATIPVGEVVDAVYRYRWERPTLEGIDYDG